MQPKEKPLFSVLIANYNNGQYLEECFQSVFSQTYDNWEIILVDDSSTDEISINLYKKYKNHPQIKVFYNRQNKGCGYTKRRCAELANGEICGFLDPDDTITPDAVEIMVNKHIEYPKHSLIYSTHFLCDENLKKLEINKGVKQVSDKGYFCSNGEQVSAFASYKNEAYQKTGGINPNLKRAVDQDLYYKLDETGKFLFVNKVLYYYRIHERGISTTQNELKAYYWHLLTINYTYKRRKQNNYPFNITKQTLKNKWEYYYLRKLTNLIEQNQIKPLKRYYYFTYKAFIINTFSPKLLLKTRISLIPLKRFFIHSNQ